MHRTALAGVPGRAVRVAAVAAALALAVCPGGVLAATFCVNDAAGLQAALDQAAANGAADVIRLVQGTYAGPFSYGPTEGYSLTLEGGWTPGCAGREADPAATLLDGHNEVAVLTAVAVGQSSVVTLDGLTVANGYSSTSSGGGIFSQDCSLTLSNTIVSGNESTRNGGGVAVEPGTFQPWLAVHDSMLEDNVGNYGGAIYAEGLASATIDGSTLRDNRATNGPGGGAMLFSCTSGAFTGNEWVGNSGEMGGGLLFFGVAASLSDNDFHGNVALYGGGLYVNGADITVTNNTLSGNSATRGGGIYVSLYGRYDTARLYNNVIWGNQATAEGAEMYVSNNEDGQPPYSTVTIEYNNFNQERPADFWIAQGDGYVVSASNQDADPLFVDGPGGNLRLGRGSPCVGAGSNAAPGLPATDKDGRPRVIGTTVDIGAFEQPSAPSTPTGVQASDGTQPFRVTVTWTDVAGEDGYLVYEADAAGGPYTEVGNVGADTTSFDATVWCGGVVRYYRVVAYTYGGDSPPSDPDVGSTGDCPPPPDPPASVAASDGDYPDRVLVTWSDVTGEEGYRVWRSADPESGYAAIGTAEADGTSFEDALPCASGPFYYRVTSFSVLGESAPSNYDAGSTGDCPPPPDTPASVAASDGAYPDRVRVTWTDVSGETGYRIWRSLTEGGGYEQIDTVDADVTAYDDLLACESGDRYYRLTAFSANGESAPSSPDVGFTAACEASVLFADDFNDGTIDDGSWDVLYGAWAVSSGENGRLVSSLRRKDLVIASGLTAAAGRYEVDVRRTSRWIKFPNAAVVFALQDGGNYRYVRVKRSAIQIGQVGTVGLEAPSGVRASGAARMPVGAWHRLRVDVHPSGLVRAYRDSEGEPLVEWQFADAPSGSVGLAVSKARSQFDNVVVWDPAALPLR